MNQNSLGAIPQVPITIKSGGLFYLPFTYKDSDGNTIPLTGYNARMQIWSSRTASGTAALDIGTYGTNSNQGDISINAITGSVAITILPSFTPVLEALLSKGWAEFHFYDADDNDIPLFEGPICIEAGGIR
jgi:hypothetical protein